MDGIARCQLPPNVKLSPEVMRQLQKPGSLQDGEVLGMDSHGNVVQWNGEDHEVYSSGQTLKQFGIHKLQYREAARVGVPTVQVDLAVAAHRQRVRRN